MISQRAEVKGTQENLKEFKRSQKEPQKSAAERKRAEMRKEDGRIERTEVTERIGNIERIESIEGRTDAAKLPGQMQGNSLDRCRETS